MGFRVDIEKLLPGGGSIDAALESKQRRIACEISVTTSGDHEMGNIKKCLEAGYDPVVLVVSDVKRVRKLSEQVKAAFPTEGEKVQCLTLPALFLLLEEIAATMKNRRETVRGYEVDTRHRVVCDHDKLKKKSAVAAVISKTIVQSMMRPKKEGDGT